MKKRVLSILLVALMVVSLLPTVAFATETAGLGNFEKVQKYTDGKFTDVETDDWFEKNVSTAYELNLMIGKSDDFFDTESNLTVAEAMTIAARLRSIYYTGKAEFEQGDPWYQAYADYCKANGIADPADYNMNKAITRGEFAQILAKALPADALKKINTVQDNMIPDVKKADKFSAEIYLLYRAGVLVGNDKKGTFAPDSNIKRVEVAAITTRMADVSLRESIRLVKPSNGGGSYTPPAPTPTTYTVEFNMNGHGEQIESKTGIISGSTITAPTAPSATGWKFKGWYTDSDCTTEWKFDIDTVVENITLYAKWVEVKTVADILATDDSSFPISDEKAWRTDGLEKCYNNGNLYFVSVKPTISLPLTTDVIGSGDDFICVDSNVTFTFKMTEGKLTAIVVSGSVGLDGTYTAPAPTYTVTFDLNGVGGAIDPQTVDKDDKVTRPDDPTDTNHTFKGWYNDSEYATEWNFETDTVTENTTLYAKWTRPMSSILGTVQNFPSTEDNAYQETIPTAWVKTIDNTYKGYIANKGISTEILTLKEGSKNPFSCKTSNPFTKIGDKYVFEYKNGDTPYGLFTLNMTEDGVLTSIEYDGSETTNYDRYSGTYKPALATLTMKAGVTASDWNKITITIKGNNITSGSYYFDKATVVDEADDLEETELTTEQIQSVNSTDGLSINKDGLDAVTTYKIIFIVSNSANDSQTIETTYEIGEAPPPM